jgi:hypothetical protein
MAAEARKPSFVYIGTSKAGSTWLFNVLATHPQVYLASAKGLYYFDKHYTRGRDWYLDQFAAAGDRAAAGEISHSYLSSPEAAPRIADLNPEMRLLACLREPVDRAFSDYLDLVKNGVYDGPFETALERFPRLLDRGRYASHLRRYYEHFPRQQLHVGLFDDLRSNAQAYADGVFDFLGVTRMELPQATLKSRMPAASPRSALMAGTARSASRLAKRAGLNRFRSRVKRSTVVRQALYRPYTDDRPTIDPTLAAELHRAFAADVQELDCLLGTPVAPRWGYGASTSGVRESS